MDETAICLNTDSKHANLPEKPPYGMDYCLQCRLLHIPRLYTAIVSILAVLVVLDHVDTYDVGKVLALASWKSTGGRSRYADPVPQTWPYCRGPR